MSYIDTIKARARLDKKTIVLPETTDKRTLIAAAKIMEEGIANIIMIGDEEKIMDGAGWLSGSDRCEGDQSQDYGQAGRLCGSSV